MDEAQELAYQYAREGACLALVARREQALKGVAAAALERGAPDVLVFPADVSDPEQSRRAVEETVAYFGKRAQLASRRLYIVFIKFSSYPYSASS